MCVLLSNRVTTYPAPQTVRVGDTDYSGIIFHDEKELIDADGRQKKINFMDGEKSEFVSFVENKKVVKENEYYRAPREMVLGGRNYHNVVSRTTIPGKYSEYTVFTPYGHFNRIRVKPNGRAVDINELQARILLRNLKQPFVNLMSKIHA